MSSKIKKDSGWYVSPEKQYEKWMGYWDGETIKYGIDESGTWFMGVADTVQASDIPVSYEEVIKRLRPIMDELGLVPGVEYYSPISCQPIAKRVATVGGKIAIVDQMVYCPGLVGVLMSRGIWATPVAAIDSTIDDQRKINKILSEESAQEKPMMEFIADNSVKEFKKYQWYKSTVSLQEQVKAMYYFDGIGHGSLGDEWHKGVRMNISDSWELMSHNEIIYFLGNMFSQIYGSSSAVWLDSKKTKKGFVSRKALNLMVGYGEATLTCGGGADAITVFDKGIWLEPVVKKMFKNEPIEESEELGKLREDMVDSLLNEFFPDSVTGTTDVNTDELVGIDKLIGNMQKDAQKQDKKDLADHLEAIREIKNRAASMLSPEANRVDYLDLTKCKPVKLKGDKVLKVDHQNKILEIFYKICNLRRNASVEECMVDAINAFELLIKRLQG